MGMSAGGPDLIQDGLVLCLDAGDRNSYQSGSLSWFDLSGNNNSGSLVNGPTFNTGSFGSIVFDGVNDYIDCGNNSKLDLYTSITIESWVKWNGNNAFDFIPIIEKQYNNQDTYFLGFNSSSRLHFGTYGGNMQSTNTIWTIGTWYSVTATYFSTPSITGSLYINGVNEPLFVNSLDTMISTTTPVYIGYRYVQNLYFNGAIAGLKIYNRALSAQEVQQNYNAQKSRFGLT